MRDDSDGRGVANERSMGVNDVEKRWKDPRAFRAAVAYCFAVIGVAAVVGALHVVTDAAAWAWALPAIFLAGGLGALIQAYRIWKRGGQWPIWQGAGWLLFALMLATLVLPVAR